MKKQIKAVSLISGGLDSLLATKVIMEQGIHVEGLNFYTGFFGVGSKVVTLRKNQKTGQYNSAKWVAERLGIKLNVINILEDFKDVFINPRYGYGARLNPCLDCKVFLVKKAQEWIVKHHFDFILTGEVIGQRPKSQRKDTLPVVARDSGANELLLRPLCAKNLKLTKPEIEGWVDREKLYGFSGRSRKPQIALAKQFGFENFPQPAGGCLLTDPSYCGRIKDLWECGNTKDYNKDDIELLKVGRHIRPSPNFKMIIGREEVENEFLENYKNQYTHLYTVNHMGPFVIILGETTESNLNLAAEITAGFGKGNKEESVQVKICPIKQAPYHLDVKPMHVKQDWYI